MTHFIHRAFVFVLLAALSLGTASAQDWNEQRIRAVAASLSKDLSDPFDKVQLANDIRRYFELRVRYSPNEYEANPEFQKKFKDAFSQFAATLFTKNFKGAEARLNKQFIFQMAQTYPKNRERFAEFYRKMGETNLYYQQMPISKMETKILQFAIILDESGTLVEVLKFTGIFPFC